MNEKERPAPRIYVADLAAYNAGDLRGEWIELTPDTTVEELQDAIHALLERCARGEYVAEEYAIHDYENFHGYMLDEYEHPETVVKVAAFISEHGALGAKLVNQSYDVDEARGILEDQYAGCSDSLADWASEFLEDSARSASTRTHRRRACRSRRRPLPRPRPRPRRARSRRPPARRARACARIPASRCRTSSGR